MARKSVTPVVKAPRQNAGDGTAVIATRISQNEKIGAVSQTTVTLQSCGPCPFRDNGCYAQQGPLGWMVARMGKHAAAESLSSLDIATAEAAAIDGMTTGLPLRLHVAGDCADNASAQVVSAAAERFMSRNRSKSWTYTHAWRKVARESWGKVSVLASCETVEDTERARDAGYATAMVVDSYPNGRKAWKLENGATAIPCPQTTGAAISCASCRLCWDDSKLRDRNVVITFEAHGSQNKRVKATLNVLNA